MIPHEAAAAMATGRTEFITMLRNRLAGGATLSDEEISGLLALVENAASDTQRDREKREEIARSLKNIRTSASGFVGLVERAEERLLSNAPDEERD